jgi:hypothetical protein
LTTVSPALNPWTSAAIFTLRPKGDVGVEYKITGEPCWS